MRHTQMKARLQKQQVRQASEGKRNLLGEVAVRQIPVVKHRQKRLRGHLHV